ncbi:hypothetical protein PENANT_c009G02436 [Penicillium antarcticum]|uniref:Uncharacterized protein n=1 Tax=Penicillium antarcticum TaxID=416450 RepID=A0A1V6Q8P5_9EURO|nr:hypothetical protein PENANT_c009G02436 [Penicillium antarcticum]
MIDPVTQVALVTTYKLASSTSCTHDQTVIYEGNEETNKKTFA